MGENKFGHCELSDSHLKQHNMVLQHYRTPGDGGGVVFLFVCCGVFCLFLFFAFFTFLLKL